MKLNPINILLFFILIFPLVKGFILKISSNSLKNSIREICSNIAIIIAIFITIYGVKILFRDNKINILKKFYDSARLNLAVVFDNNPIFMYVLVFPLVIFVVYKILIMCFDGINYIFIYPLAEKVDDIIKRKSELFKSIIGMIFQIPKALCYVIITSFLLNYLSIFNILGEYNKYLEDSYSYNIICKHIIIPISNSKIAKALPNIINDSFKVEIKEIGNLEDGKLGKRNIVYYYNGVTLDEGVKSNTQIDNFSKGLNEKEVSNRNKARNIYNWIGKKIEYDQEKAARVLNNDFNIKSGAIPAYETRKGICFDYACLFVAMCKANGLKVRIVTGQGFNGISWVSHAWNQVYIPEEGAWINVDPTFYVGGNYFGTNRFDIDHKDGKIIGEW